MQLSRHCPLHGSIMWVSHQLNHDIDTCATHPYQSYTPEIKISVLKARAHVLVVLLRFVDGATSIACHSMRAPCMRRDAL